MFIKITVIAIIHFGIFFMNSAMLAGNAYERIVNEILDKDGKIISGIEGSFNTESYNVNFGKKGEPHFISNSGANRSALGLGIIGNVIRAIAIRGNNVFDGNHYVGGTFSISGGIPAVKIASWDSTVGIISNSGIIPEKYAHYENYPNPFEPTTEIKSDFLKSGYTTLKIYDSLGQEVSQIVNENLIPGTYEAIFDADLNSGIHFYALHSGNFV